MAVLAAHRNGRRWHGSDERYTPPWLLDRVSAFLGPGWFDPCPAAFGRVPRVNGLATPWRGHVFCNPPYSNLQPWVDRFLAEPFTEGLLLIPASTDVRWFQPLFAQPVLFMAGRVSFLAPDGVVDRPAPFGSALVYRGRRRAAFARAFGDLGTVMTTYQARTRPGQLKLLT